jgi:photosystem II stability/assembly factor-like uncharacterized protein
MNARPSAATLRRRRLTALLILLAFLALVAVAIERPGGAGADAGGALVAEPVASATAANVKVLYGATPGEEPGEIFGRDKLGEGIVRYSEAGGWERMAPPLDSEGRPIKKIFVEEGASVGRTTAGGGVVAAVRVEGLNGIERMLLIRDPGSGLRTSGVPEPALLLSQASLLAYESKATVEEQEALFEEKGEQLFLEEPKGIKLAALEEADGRVGALVVPAPKEVLPQDGVLHFDGTSWTREPICLKAAPAPCQAPANRSLRVLAIDATGPGNAWMLVKGGTIGGGIELFTREGAKEWRPRKLGPEGSLGTLFSKATTQPSQTAVAVAVAARTAGQPLTVGPEGVWVDVTLTPKGGAATEATIYYDIAEGEVTGSWCDLIEADGVTRNPMCKFGLGSELPSGEGRSFAFPAQDQNAEQYGRRTITGVGQGAIMVLEGSSFVRIPLSGGGAGSSGGAALSGPEEGWLGPSYRLTHTPQASALAAWPLPFRHPLTAIAPQPGVPVGSLGSEAIAVGDEGQVARYLPGTGWVAEPLLTGSGARSKPRLRAVAWPEPETIYAVGDEGAMWIWRAATDLWEPDQSAPPNLIRGNFNGIAFDPSEPGRGYAVGKQGLLLGYGKRWTQEPLPAEVNPEVNFTAIAFAGNEAMASYNIAVREESTQPHYTGGLLVNSGSGWRVEPEALAALQEAESNFPGAVAPRQIAGLPDGGAVIVGERGGVIERNGPGQPWQQVPGGELGYPDALAAFREGGQLRALISFEESRNFSGNFDAELETDKEQAIAQPPPGQAGLITPPYPLPRNGFLARQTATGWHDEEHQSFGFPATQSGASGYDLPLTPDPILAMSVGPEGGEGWMVGGETGEGAAEAFEKEALQTAGVFRYGPGAVPPANAAAAPIPVTEGEATFAVGGNAQCAGACADLTGTGIGPDVWLRAAVRTAAGVGAGVNPPRAFLYTGAGVSGQAGLGRLAVADEEEAYARRLGAEAGAIPAYTTPAPSDVNESSLSAFGAAFAGFPAPLGSGSAPAGISIPPEATADRGAGDYSYAFESSPTSGVGGRVRVIMLDSSSIPLGGEKQCWLAKQLSSALLAGAPAIVVSSAAPPTGPEAAAVAPILVQGTPPVECALPGPAAGASAYFYDEPVANRLGTLTWGSGSIPVFGTGSLGYGIIPRFGSTVTSGFLLASVDTAARNRVTNVAPVHARLIPSIGSLALDATDGTLLRRSRPALFEALARRPVAGIRCSGQSAPSFCGESAPNPYQEIPAHCTGRVECTYEIVPEYRFSSSNPDIADFVEVDPNSTNPRAVALGSNGKPVPDPTSGLLCAFNAGTTTVTIETGGLAYSEPVTVQPGSVQQPCGTVPLRNPPPKPVALVAPPPPPSPSPAPTFPPTPSTLPPPPAPTPPAVPTTPPAPSVPTPPPVHQPPPPAPQPQPSPPFFAPGTLLRPLVPIVPPPPPPAVEPTPPSGTSPVSQPAVSPKSEEEDEAAIEHVSHFAALRHAAEVRWAVAPQPGDGGPPAALLVALLALAALGGGTVFASRRDSPELARAQLRPNRRPLR